MEKHVKMNDEVNLNRNNLDRSISPYLRQHADNPVHWQEWSEDVLSIAREQRKKILVSIGYSTCHWCHVMASEAFSDTEIARYLNENFIAIKVDREQRPDIDHYFMLFITSTTGNGGWPLNIFLTPEAEPLIAFTYIPVQPKYGLPSMMDILVTVMGMEKGTGFKPPDITPYKREETVEELVNYLLAAHDNSYGGFGPGPKFPPSSAMLLLLSYYERYRDKPVRQAITKTLDAITGGGLHDHLQGGFFRYCVDREWTIPHFEKMLYDQAMLLWVYSWAYMVLKEEKYAGTVRSILKCLDETFLIDGLYLSAHDADTLHVEGATYTWKYSELMTLLEPDEMNYMKENYFIAGDGNFNGKNHLVRRRHDVRGRIEDILLDARKQRPQPFADRKIITSWNAFTGIGLVMAWRALGDSDLLEKAESLLDRLIEKHMQGNVLSHSSLDGVLQNNEFLEDAASVLLFATYIHEEINNREETVRFLADHLNGFYDCEWFESCNRDFRKVPAPELDHPFPSSSSTVTMALTRKSILMNEEYNLNGKGKGTGHEFHDLAIFMAAGHWHIIHTPRRINWQELSLNSIQVYDETFHDCFEGVCRLDRVTDK